MPHDASSVAPALTTAEAITFLLYGFGVVMSTLALLWLATFIISKVVKALGLDGMPAPKAVPAAATAIADETIAVITAAVAFATGGKYSIKSIQKKS